MRTAGKAAALVALIALVAVPLRPAESRYVVSTIAGSDLVGDGGSALTAQLSVAEGVSLDPAGNVYIADAGDHRVRKVTPAGIISSVAGDGLPGSRGDGGPAQLARLSSPFGVAADAAGNVYIADYANRNVRRITPDGIINIFLTDGPSLVLAGSRNIALDALGNVYVSDFAGHRVYKITPDGAAKPVAGIGAAGFSGDGGPATSAQLSSPAGIAVDRAGNIYIADSNNNRIRKVSGGTISTVAKDLALPTGLGLDPPGNLFVADSGNTRILKLTLAGAQTTLSDTGLSTARDLAVDENGNIYIADGARVVKRTSSGVLVVIAGDGSFGNSGDGSLGASAHLHSPQALALDAGGYLYIADSGAHRVRRLTPAGVISTVAGYGGAGFRGDAGPANSAQLNAPKYLAIDSAGNQFIADTGNNRLRKVNPAGVISTVTGDGSPSVGVEGVTVDGAGNLYISDPRNHRIRRIAPGGAITIIAGTGTAGFLGDGGAATAAQINAPSGLCLDRAGNLYFADRAEHRVRKITPGGVIGTIAGTGFASFSGDGTASYQASLNSPSSVAADAAGNLFVADTGNQRIRKITPEGFISTVAGNDAPGFSGDGGSALLAQFNNPTDVAVDNAGNLYVADFGNHRVRKLTPGENTSPPEQLQSTGVVQPPACFREPLPRARS